MSETENIKKVQRLFSEVYTGGNFALCEELLSPDFQLHDPNAPDFHGGIQGFKKWEGAFHQAFPKKQSMIDELLTAGDKVVVRWTVTGKQEGDLPEIPNTGKEFKLTGMMIFAFTQGKISAIWNQWDKYGLYRQLGVFIK